jgi:L-asparaginase II
VHAALAAGMLAEVGLGPESLICPPDWPAAPAAVWRLGAAAAAGPQRLFHNCSGKHAAMLRACVHQGWPLAYTDAAHPLQRAIRDEVAAAAGEPPDPLGVDGCGVPTFSTTVAGLARAFARLASDPGLAPAADAMARFAPLTSDGDRPEAQIARWCHAAVKGGAEGCLGVAWLGGLGIAAKCWTGQGAPAAAAAVAVLRLLGILPEHPAAMLAAVANPVVRGGGRPVGRLEVLAGP